MVTLIQVTFQEHVKEFAPIFKIQKLGKQTNLYNSKARGPKKKKQNDSTDLSGSLAFCKRKWNYIITKTTCGDYQQLSLKLVLKASDQTQLQICLDTGFFFRNGLPGY